MPLDFLLDRFDELPALRALGAALPVPGSRLGVGGLFGSSPAVLVAALARRLPQRVFAVVAPTPADAMCTTGCSAHEYQTKITPRFGESAFA